MKIVFIFGSTAVGKMTVGQELMKITELRLFHNHFIIEPVLEIFGEFHKGVMHRMREVICEEFAASAKYGMIMTGMVSMGSPNWQELVDPYLKIFNQHQADIFYVELVASQKVRLQRNATENRLHHKASKRDIAKSNQLLIDADTRYQYSEEGQIKMDNYIRIDNSDLAPDTVAQMIKEKFSL
jgi:hypothetical protein